MDIRPESPGDIAAIREVSRQAFGQEQEGRIVDALRANGATTLSLVATRLGRVVGYAVFSPLLVGDLVGAALGPMAVLPEEQGRGVGASLVDVGIATLTRNGCPCIAVVGHPTYYPRFGFRPASARGITCEWDVPDDAFLLLVLDHARMREVTGQARYRPEFSTVI